MALRGGHTTRDRVDVVPTLATAERAATLVERTAAGAAFEAVRRVELLLDHWGAAPAGRAARRRARRPRAQGRRGPPARGRAHRRPAGRGRRGGRLLAAGATTTTATPVFAPTDEFDAWTRRPARRTLDACSPRAWLATTAAARPGRDPRPRRQGPRRAVGGELQRLRRRDPPDGARAGRALPPGEVLATGTGPASLVDRLAWLRPRRPRSRADQVAWALREATVPRRARPRRAAAVRPRAARRHGDAAALLGAAAARARRPRPAPGRPDRRRARPARARAGPPAPGGRPTWSRAAAPRSTASRARPYAARSTSAGRPPRCTPSSPASPDAGAAAAELPRRRHGPDLRHHPGRSRRGVPARRRRGRPDRAAAAPAGRLAGPAAAGADRAGQHRPARRAAPPAARARRGSGGRGARRLRCTSPAPTCCAPAPRRSAAARSARPASRPRSLRGWWPRSGPATGPSPNGPPVAPRSPPATR